MIVIRTNRRRHLSQTGQGHLVGFLVVYHLCWELWQPCFFFLGFVINHCKDPYLNQSGFLHHSYHVRVLNVAQILSLEVAFGMNATFFLEGGL